eukprot:GSMAST32.ASY1.ANO1.1875.1 assembled CDS
MEVFDGFALAAYSGGLDSGSVRPPMQIGLHPETIFAAKFSPYSRVKLVRNMRDNSIRGSNVNRVTIKGGENVKDTIVFCEVVPDIDVDKSSVAVQPWVLSVFGLPEGGILNVSSVPQITNLTDPVEDNTSILTETPQDVSSIFVESLGSFPPRPGDVLSFGWDSNDNKIFSLKNSILRSLHRQLHGHILAVGSIFASIMMGNILLFKVVSGNSISNNKLCQVGENVCLKFADKFANNNLNKVKATDHSEHDIVVPGHSKKAHELLENIRMVLGIGKNSEDISKKDDSRVLRPGGIILHGPPGCGKRNVSGCVCISSHKLFDMKSTNYLNNALNDITKLSTDYTNAEPNFIRNVTGFYNSVFVVLEDLDMISSHPSISSKLLSFVKSIKKISNICIIGVCRNLNCVPQSFSGNGMLELSVKLSPPVVMERQEMLDVIIKNHQIIETRSLISSELSCLTKEKGLNNHQKTNSINWKYYQAALHEIRPSQLHNLDVKVPIERWVDIGGYDDIKRRLQQLIQWQWLHPEKFNSLGVAATSGVLLYGPSGCGKTLFAHALAGECSANFVSVKSTELFSQYLGESEAALRNIFTKARAAAPCILFFDEIDSLAMGRDLSGGGDKASGVAERMLATLLNEMDGVESSNGVVVLAATNLISNIDKALLRPGRIDQSIYIGPPDKSTQKSILEINTKKTPLAKDVNFDEILAERWVEKRTGADLCRLCQEAALVALRSDLNIPSVSAIHFKTAAIELGYTHE